jgi:hypothetical protein
MDGHFSGAENMPLDLNFLVEISKKIPSEKADPPATRKDDNKKATATAKSGEGRKGMGG